MRRQLLFVVAVVFLIRLPFLNQAIQGDDVYYLAGAMHAQIDPLHPNHARYVFLGDLVDMRGHPHPPFNAWFLGGLLAAFGDIHEAPFHAAYILFSLVAALSMWSLAGRFSPRPLAATLLFLATPAFVVNGNSLESDLPLLAFWMASTALFTSAVDSGSGRRLAAAGASMLLAALAAYQSVVLVPILALYLWTTKRNWRPAWTVLLVVPVTLAAWQLWERASTGELPASVLAGYFQTYGLQTLSAKLRNAAALTAHTAWLVFPVLAIAAFNRLGRGWWVTVAVVGLAGAFADPNPLFWLSLGTGTLVLAWCIRSVSRQREQDVRFLAGWILIFFAAALILFFAGSARYLLPVAAPVALLASRVLARHPRRLAGGFALGITLSLSLGVVSYQHWDGYRQFARSLRRETEHRRTWINGEWGLRYYFETDGGLPLMRGQPVQPGDLVVSSELAFPIRFTTGGAELVPVAEEEIRASLPLRLAGLGARSGYSSAYLGLRPFDISTGPIDRVKAELAVERKPALSYLPMNAPEAEQQIVGGVYELEGGQWRWMGQRALLLLKRPEAPAPFEVSFYIPPQAPARRISVEVDGELRAEQTYAAPGAYTLAASPVAVSSETVAVTITIDKTYSVPGDHRRLGIILSGVGFKP